MAEETMTKEEQLAPIQALLLEKLYAIADCYRDIVKAFGGLDQDETTEKAIEYYNKKIDNANRMAGWYDPEAKKKAKIDRLRDQLNKLEKELEEEGL